MDGWENQNFEADWKKAFDGAEFTPSESVWQSINLSLTQGQSVRAGIVDQNFELGWKKAFEGAEQGPSGNVWKAIDVRLMQAENLAMKQRVVFYQRMAAASIVVLFLFSGYLLFKPDGANSSQVITRNNSASNSKTNTPNPSVDPDLIANQKKSTLSDSGTDKDLTSNQNSKAGNQTSKSSSQTPQTGLIAITVNKEEGRTIEMRSGSLASSVPQTDRKLYKYENSRLAIEPLPLGNLMPKTVKPNDFSIAYRLADLRPAVNVSKKKALAHENTWASVGFAVGNFLPGTGGNSLMNSNSALQGSQYNQLSLQDNSRSVKDEKIKAGTSMSFLVSAGKRIFKRWVVQGGVNYLNQTSQSNSSTIVVAQANQADSKFASSFSPETTNSVTYTTPSEINSTFQFVSFPVQAGYMVVDRKFGVQVNGGVSPDFFWRNSVYDESTKVGAVSSASGSNETFKAVSLAGLGGVEVSYRFSRHYRVSLVPGFRYSLTPIYKENTLASAKPFVADVGLKFRYVF